MGYQFVTWNNEEGVFFERVQLFLCLRSSFPRFTTTSILTISMAHLLQRPDMNTNPIVGYTCQDPEGGTVPLLRWWHPSSSDHFYCTYLRGGVGYSFEGVTGYLFSKPTTGLSLFSVGVSTDESWEWRSIEGVFIPKQEYTFLLCQSHWCCVDFAVRALTSIFFLVSLLNLSCFATDFWAQGKITTNCNWEAVVQARSHPYSLAVKKRFCVSSHKGISKGKKGRKISISFLTCSTIFPLS